MTRIELRVAVASLGKDRRRNALDVARRLQTLLADAGAVVVGMKIPGDQSGEPVALADLGRLQLAGPPEGRQAGDRPFWGSQDGPRWLPKWRRKTG